jgi:hypothetical protein
MNTVIREVILSGSIDFTLLEDGGLTLRFRHENWPSKLTEGDAIKLSQALGTMLRSTIRQLNSDGSFFISRPPTLEARIKLVNP